MYPLTEINARRMDAPAFPITKAEPLMIEELGADQEAEVIAFLGERPGHTFGMTGFIRSNGLVSSHNLGSFYACRDKAGQLQGVALIGRYILFETRSDAAIEVFAHLAQDCRNAHMLLGEQGEVETFWWYYADGGQSPRLYGREYLFEQRWPVELKQEVAGLRVATMDELDLIVPAHAQIAFDESGIDPLLVDPEGFWVDPPERGKGIGSRCMSQLSRSFLMRSNSVCVLVNERFKSAQAFYKKAGFKFISHYDTIFLKQQVH